MAKFGRPGFSLKLSAESHIRGQPSEEIGLGHAVTLTRPLPQSRQAWALQREGTTGQPWPRVRDGLSLCPLRRVMLTAYGRPAWAFLCVLAFMFTDEAECIEIRLGTNFCTLVTTRAAAKRK
jgi:hypothetical protein